MRHARTLHGLAALLAFMPGCVVAEMVAPGPSANDRLREELLEAEHPHRPTAWPQTWGQGQSNERVVFGRGAVGARSDDPTSWQGPDRTAFSEPAAQPGGGGLVGGTGSGALPESEPLIRRHPVVTTENPFPTPRGEVNRAADAYEALQRARGTVIALPSPGPSPSPTPPSVGP